MAHPVVESPERGRGKKRERLCSRCGAWKSLAAFSFRSPPEQHRRFNWCRECARVYNKACRARAKLGPRATDEQVAEYVAATHKPGAGRRCAAGCACARHAETLTRRRVLRVVCATCGKHTAGRDGGFPRRHRRLDGSTPGATGSWSPCPGSDLPGRLERVPLLVRADGRWQ